MEVDRQTAAVRSNFCIPFCVIQLKRKASWHKHFLSIYLHPHFSNKNILENFVPNYAINDHLLKSRAKTIFTLGKHIKFK